MTYPVVKGAGYLLCHTPEMILRNGTTQTTEAQLNPNSEYLKQVPDHIRTYDQVVSYLPNQVYIGNVHPDKLREVPQPWNEEGKEVEGAERFGHFGEILPEDEFIALIKISDVFDLVFLNKEFTASVKEKLEKHPLIGEDLIKRLKDGAEDEVIKKHLDAHGEGLYYNGELVGVVSRAHDVDVNLSAHVMFENLVVKASGILAALHAVKNSEIDPNEIEYVIECSEEACGDINQRGGGNFAKAIAELAGLKNASGSDTRGFCAAPTHALILASSLVHAGTFKSVLVVAGGSTAKLGMNGKDHVKKGLPILEDVVAGFGVVISQNDGENPVLRTDIVGRHTVGTGSSPQGVISALVLNPLKKNDLKITDIDKFSVEMQNPDITKPAGAGDVPSANFKMIGALAVMQKEFEKADLPKFIQEHGMEGWAPTQGHIPSGVPYVGFGREDILEGKIDNVMFVGKGSLFLGRMTNQFDGVSIVMEKNKGMTDKGTAGVSEEEVRKTVADAMRKLAASFAETEGE